MSLLVASALVAGVFSGVAGGSEDKPEPEGPPPIEKPAVDLATLELVDPAAMMRGVATQTADPATMTADPASSTADAASVEATQVSLQSTADNSFTARPQPGTIYDGGYADRYVYLNRGTVLTLQLTWASANDDIDMYLYNRSDVQVARSSLAEGTAEGFTYSAPSPGWYKVRLYGYDVWSYPASYTLNWGTSIVGADDEIPGMAFPASQFTGQFDNGDGVDVYRFSAVAGQRLQVWLNGPAGTDFDLHVHKPGSVSANIITGQGASSESASSVEGVDFTAPTTGSYYVVVRAWQPVTARKTYNVGYQIGGTTRAMVRAYGPDTLNYGATMNVAGYVTSLGGVPLPGRKVYLVRGSSTLRSASAGSSGYFNLWDRPSSKADYMAKVLSASDLVGAVSHKVTVWPKPLVSKPSIKTTVRKKKSYTVTGTLKPRHPSGTKAVKLQAFRYESGTWKLKKYTWATVKNYSTYSKYTGKMSFPTAGRWRVTAYTPKDAGHASSWSGGREVTVNKTSLSARGGGVAVYGSTEKVSGTLRGPTGKVLKKKKVALEESWDGSYWSHVKNVKSNSKGVVSATVRPNSTRYYRFNFKGDNSYAPKASKRRKVTLRPRVISGKTNSSGSASRWFMLPAGATRVIIEGYGGYTDYNFYLYDRRSNLISAMRTSGNTNWYVYAPKGAKYNLRVNSAPRTPYRLTFQ